MADQIERFDQLVTLQRMLAAKTIRVRTLLNFTFGKRRGHNPGAGMHLHLMNLRADAGNKKLLDALEGHHAFRDRYALHPPHFFVSREQQINLALDRNFEGILQERILPGIDVSFFRGQRHVFALRQRRRLRNRHRLCGAGLDALARQAIGRSESPRPVGHHANPDP